MTTITGIVEVGVAALVIAIAFRPSDPLAVSSVSSYNARIAGSRVAMLETVVAVRPSDPRGL